MAAYFTQFTTVSTFFRWVISQYCSFLFHLAENERQSLVIFGRIGGINLSTVIIIRFSSIILTHLRLMIVLIGFFNEYFEHLCLTTLDNLGF